MRKAFKEFIASLKNPNFGRVILSRTFGQAVWYWTQIFFVLSLIPAIIILLAVTYFTPQLPRFVREKIPDGYVQIKSGKLETNQNQVFKTNINEYSIIVDLLSDPETITDFPLGLTILQDRIVIADGNSTTKESFTDIPDFRLEKSSVAAYINTHITTIFAVILGLILFGYLIIGFTIWTYRFISFFTIGLIYLVLAGIMHKKQPYMEMTKLAVYSSTISFVFSFILGLFNGWQLWLFNLAIIIYFGHRWLKDLPSTTPPVTPTTPETSVKPTKPLKPKLLA